MLLSASTSPAGSEDQKALASRLLDRISRCGEDELTLSLDEKRLVQNLLEDRLNLGSESEPLRAQGQVELDMAPDDTASSVRAVAESPDVAMASSIFNKLLNWRSTEVALPESWSSYPWLQGRVMSSWALPDPQLLAVRVGDKMHVVNLLGFNEVYASFKANLTQEEQEFLDSFFPYNQLDGNSGIKGVLRVLGYKTDYENGFREQSAKVFGTGEFREDPWENPQYAVFVDEWRRAFEETVPALIDRGFERYLVLWERAKKAV